MQTNPNSERVSVLWLCFYKLKQEKRKIVARTGRGVGGEGPQLSKQTNSAKETLHTSTFPSHRHRFTKQLHPVAAQQTFHAPGNWSTVQERKMRWEEENEMGINKGKMGLCLPSWPGSVPSHCKLLQALLW